MRAKLLTITLLICLPLRMTAQTTDPLMPDSTAAGSLILNDSAADSQLPDVLNPGIRPNNFDKTTQFRATQLILPGTLIAVSTFGLWNNVTRAANVTIRDKMNDVRTRQLKFDDYVQYLPVVSYVGLGVAGARSKHNFKERLLVTGTSYLAMGIMTNAVKYTAKEMRPDGSSRNSYPSGHTATVFMGAELVRSEYGTGYGVAAYTIACGVAFMRIYNGRHWTTDVLAGAGIGILSARIGYWMLPVTRRWFGMERNKNRNSQVTDVALMTAPFYDYNTHAVGGSLGFVF